MEDCVFCKIIKKELPCTKVYEDKDFMIIKDINPKAKVHLLAIPFDHVPSLDMMTKEGYALLAKMIDTISHNAEKLGVGNGYRLIINQGDDACPDVKHTHIHILGGEKLADF